jgi:8-oxo-dGTP pyrophosphatase MutT (NUDIX family)
MTTVNMTRTISIAAALIDDGEGEVFLVRKRGTTAFMQAGGKIELGETAFAALVRELTEELRFTPVEAEVRYLGTFTSQAANEPGHLLQAALFHIRLRREFHIAAELEEAIWLPIERAYKLHLAPFTRNHVLPLASNLNA